MPKIQISVKYKKINITLSSAEFAQCKLRVNMVKKPNQEGPNYSKYDKEKVLSQTANLMTPIKEVSHMMLDMNYHFWKSVLW